MKTLTTTAVLIMLAVTVSAETWRQKVQRLECENRNLKKQVAALTKQVIKLQKENNDLLGDKEVPEEKPQLTPEQQRQLKLYEKCLAGKKKELAKYTEEQKNINNLLESRYSIVSRAKRREKEKLERRLRYLKYLIDQAKKSVKWYEDQIECIKTKQPQ